MKNRNPIAADSADGLLTGKHAFIQQLIACGVKYMFGNPGTTEQAIIDAIQDYDDISFISGLHETVAMGMAESYARATKTPSVVELHAGPGLGNAMGMVYNAWSANIPMVLFACVPAHDSLYTEPALSGPLSEMARPFAKWSYDVRSAYEIPQILRRAIKIAREAPCGPVVLVLPTDVLDQETDADILSPSYISPRIRPDKEELHRAADSIIAAQNPALFVADGVWASDAVAEVEKLAETLGAPVYQGYTNAVNISGDHSLNAGVLPLFYPEGYRAALSEHDLVLAIGTDVFRILFADREPILDLRTTIVHVDLNSWELAKNQPSIALKADPKAALEELMIVLKDRWSDETQTTASIRRRKNVSNISRQRDQLDKSLKSTWGTTPMSSSEAIVQIIDALPDDCIVYDEAITGSAPLLHYLKPSKGKWFRAAGGGLGPGTTGPIGLKLANPNQPVLGVIGDGSILYTIQALWTAAHYEIPAVWVVLNNSSYKVLKMNVLAYLADEAEGREFIAADMDKPLIDYVGLAESFGVAAHRLTDVGDIKAAIQSAFATNKPTLIDIAVNRNV